MSSHGVPVDPVAAGLNYTEQISYRLDLAFHPAIGPHDPFRIFTTRLHPYAVSPPPQASQIPKFVSLMPVVIPDADIDPKMLLQVPNTSVDYKMIVKAPDLESADALKAPELAK